MRRKVDVGRGAPPPSVPRLASLVAAALSVTAALALVARAEPPKGEAVEYKHGDVALEGYLALPQGKPRAGVLLVHEWWGLGDHVKRCADELAKAGYAAFGLDMYGKGVYLKTPDEAGKWAGKFKNDRALMRARALAGLEVLKSKANVDQVAAIGYCFGGTTVLEIARSGADVKAVVSFHGGLETPNLADAKNVKARVLVCHGADDAFISEKELATFEQEMRDAHVDWQLVKYGGAVHSFTNKDADKFGIKGVAYNEKADKRSWKAMLDLFDETFSK